MSYQEKKSFPCPHCGQIQDETTGVLHENNPNPGDVSICIDCAGLGVFTENLTLRLPTEQEAQEITQEPLARAAMAAVRVLIAIRKAREADESQPAPECPYRTR